MVDASSKRHFEKAGVGMIALDAGALALVEELPPDDGAVEVVLRAGDFLPEGNARMTVDLDPGGAWLPPRPPHHRGRGPAGGDGAGMVRPRRAHPLSSRRRQPVGREFGRAEGRRSYRLPSCSAIGSLSRSRPSPVNVTPLPSGSRMPTASPAARRGRWPTMMSISPPRFQSPMSGEPQAPAPVDGDNRLFHGPAFQTLIASAR